MTEGPRLIALADQQGWQTVEDLDAWLLQDPKTAHNAALRDIWRLRILRAVPRLADPRSSDPT